MRTKFNVLAFIASLLALSLSSCGGGGVGERLSNTSGTVTTPIYAGAGQGVPGSGTQCGTATFSNPGTGELNVSISLTGGWTFATPGTATEDPDPDYNIHLAAGLDRPKNPANGKYTVAPGQFPYKFTGSGTSHVCNVTGLPAGDLITALHLSVVSPSTGGTDPTDPVLNGPCGTTTLCLGEGATRIPAGVVTVTYSNWNVTVTFDTSSTAYSLSKTYLYLGTTPPPNLTPGLQPFKHDAPPFTPFPNPEVDSFTFPLSQFFGNLDLCGTPPRTLYIYAHAAVTGGSGNTAIGYNCDGTNNFRPGKNHFTYSLITLPGCNCDTPGDPGTPGIPGTQETAWAFDLTGEVDPAVAKDEWGWFEHFGFQRWGWFMRLFNFS